MSWHIIPVKYSTWSITLLTKRAHKITNFKIFECFNESSPNSSCQNWNHKVKVYSNFESLFNVTKDNSSVFFYLKPLYFGQKEPIEVTFECLGEKSPSFLCHIWNYNSVFFKSLYHSSASWEKTLLYFFSWNCTWFGQKESIEVQDFRLLTAHFFDFWLLLLKVYRNFCWKVQISYVSLFWRLMQNLKKNWSVVSSNDKNLVNFDLSTQKSQKFALSLVPIVQSI